MTRGTVFTFLLFALVAAAPRPVLGQDTRSTEIETPSSDLYLKRRPPGAGSRVPKDLEPLLKEKENLAVAKRKQAIGMLEQLLKESPHGVAAAEAIFKLAELYWEEARRQYIIDIQKAERLAEACRQRSEDCVGAPKPPQLELARSEKLYLRLVNEFPDFRRMDLAYYLLGFAAREDGRPDDALGWFKQVIDKFPESPLWPDAWMMMGEDQFAKGDFPGARDAYARVLEHPESPVFDLALFKSAWCDWKLGDTAAAAKRFKLVLDLAAEAEKSGTNEERRRRAQLRDEALEYLILLLSDDESVTAKDAYDFLASIQGERYSREILEKLSERYFAQTRYVKAIDAYKFLISLDPAHPAAPSYQIQLVESYSALDDPDQALAAAKELADRYGPGSDWAKENRARKKLVAKAFRQAEEVLRGLAKNFHAEAQRDEKQRKAPEIKKYTRASDLYAFYLSRFEKSPQAVEIRFLRAQILYFKLSTYELAGDEFLAVGKTAPVGKFHKEALLAAIEAFEKSRPAGAGGKEVLAADKKFDEAVDLYTTLFRDQADPALIAIVYKKGKRYYDNGNYDQAVKSFGVIVTKYPDNPNAGAAGDALLDALVKAEDYENVEEWSRKLKKAKAFQAPAEQARLDRLIVESIGKSAEKYQAGGHYEKAAGFYMRVAKEFPDNKLAPQALFNAGVVLEKAQQPEQAAAAYLAVVEKYPNEKQYAPRAAYTAASVYEQMAYFDKAAGAYHKLWEKWPGDPKAADALFNYGVLNQAQGKVKPAITAYATYAKKFATNKDAEDVAFRIGVVYEESSDYGRAAAAFKGYTDRYRKGSHLVEAHTRSARAYLKLGKERQAAGEMADAVKLWKALPAADKRAHAKWAAEARYLQGELLFKDYQRISLDVKPKALPATLEKKTKLLGEAEKVYIDVVDFADPGWVTAALYRIGKLYEGYADELRNFEPKGLSEEEAMIYQEEVQKVIVMIEEKALDRYETGYKKALELKVYNDYTKLLRESLARNSSEKYPPEREVRVRSRVGDHAPEPPILKDVVRE